MLRNTVSLGIAFIVMLLISPKGIEILHRLKFGQEVRDDGPEAHLKKQGTPTMGGILFLIAITIGVLPFIGENKGLLPAYLLGIGFGIVGFIDDYLKVVKHQSEGFNPKQKMAAQVVISLLYIAYLYFFGGHSTAFLLPFVKGQKLLFGIWFFPISLFIITATDTGANFTDGIDGLCGSVTAVIVFFLFLADQFFLGGDTLGARRGARRNSGISRIQCLSRKGFYGRYGFSCTRRFRGGDGVANGTCLVYSDFRLYLFCGSAFGHFAGFLFQDDAWKANF